MTRKNACKLRDDIGKSLCDDDYNEDVYLSIKHVGTKTFQKCVYHEVENWIFIWTREDSFMVDRKDLGDMVIAPLSFHITVGEVAV